MLRATLRLQAPSLAARTTGEREYDRERCRGHVDSNELLHNFSSWTGAGNLPSLGEASVDAPFSSALSWSSSTLPAGVLCLLTSASSDEGWFGTTVTRIHPDANLTVLASPPSRRRSGCEQWTEMRGGQAGPRGRVLSLRGNSTNVRPGSSWMGLPSSATSTNGSWMSLRLHVPWM